MVLHVLPGDSLVEPFTGAALSGDVAVFRECLVEGPVEADSIGSFFALRHSFLSESYGEKAGFFETHVRPEIEAILSTPAETEIDLWFEHELFCQVNLWFLIERLVDRENLFAVVPPITEGAGRFAGWALLGPEGLTERYAQRIRITERDRKLGSLLWRAFAARDQRKLMDLASEVSQVFVHLRETAEAAADIDSTPEKHLKEIAESGVRDFGEAFRRFSLELPVYGFGDLQVRSIWNKVTSA